MKSARHAARTSQEARSSLRSLPKDIHRDLFKERSPLGSQILDPGPVIRGVRHRTRYRSEHRRRLAVQTTERFHGGY